MLKTKPIIGLAGGIGSGKSSVARWLGEQGGCVFDADAVARRALDLPQVRQALVDWMGPGILDAEGRVDRGRVADRVFDAPEARRRLESIVHPVVSRQRDEETARAMQDPGVRFVVYDVPLLYEVGLEKECDYVLFVDADRAVRLERVRKTRGWDEWELARREKNQMDPTRKMDLADDIIYNSGEESQSISQVRAFLERIL